jgi:glutamate-ammonia-ligase adenylyltransferase
LRRFKRRETLRVAYGDIIRGQGLETVTRQISYVADAIVEAAVRAARVRLEARRPAARALAGEAGRFVVLALGKLGGCELNYSSDIDLMFLYDAPRGADAVRQQNAAEYFDRMSREVVKLLAEQTDLGAAYRVDLRLRPSGNAGPVAVGLDGFLAYQREKAWTWEHMALTRARSVAGDAALVGRANALIRSVLCLPRERERLNADIRDMRARLEREKPAASPWQIKQAPGGLIDLEFIAQALQLAHAAETPAILAGNTRRVFDAALHEDYIGAADHELLSHAATLYQSLTQILTLALEGDFDPRRAPAGLRRLLRRAGDAPDFDHLEADLTQTEHSVRRRFEKLLDGAPESAASSARGGQ